MLTIDIARAAIARCQEALGHRLSRGMAFDLLCDQFPKIPVRDISDIIKHLYNA